YSNYASVYNSSTCTMPAPVSYCQMGVPSSTTDVATYNGDVWPRKAAATAGTAGSLWDVTDPNGPAVTAAAFLGWWGKYRSGSSLPGLTSTRVGGGLNLSGTYSPSTAYASGTSSGSDFRDATWERYGYDLDVNTYITKRNTFGSTNWDPRW